MDTHNSVQDSKGDKILYFVSGCMLLLISLMVILPLVNILAASFSSGTAVATGRVLLWPVDPSLAGYNAVFSNNRVLTGYLNTLFYTGAGTLINVALTMITAYPLAMPKMHLKRSYMFLFSFTMFFSGGLVPSYMLVSRLGMVNTVWAMLIPGAMSVYNMIVARTFIQNNIPIDLLEAARIDGCDYFNFFFRIVLPLSKAVIAVISLYYAVSHWNSYFNALIYLNSQKLYPLQLVLRQILIMNSIELMDVALEGTIASMADLLKYALIVVSTVPILCVYPFVQRYFIKGVMIGSIKG